jgi:hypothetical protein
MHKINFARISRGIRVGLRRHAPEILTGLGCAGVITTVGLAIYATPKALELLEERKREECTDELTPVEVVKTTWKCYIPTIVTGAFSLGCIIGANSVHMQRHAALAAAYKLSEAAFTEYRDTVGAEIGPKKERVILDKINEHQIEKNPPVEQKIIRTGLGDTLCLEPLSGRYFYSDLDTIRKAAIKINQRMQHSFCGSASVNDFYDAIGLEYTDLGESMGWNASNLIDLHITSRIVLDDKPCAVIGHYNPAAYDF